MPVCSATVTGDQSATLSATSLDVDYDGLDDTQTGLGDATCKFSYNVTLDADSYLNAGTLTVDGLVFDGANMSTSAIRMEILRVVNPAGTVIDPTDGCMAVASMPGVWQIQTLVGASELNSAPGTTYTLGAEFFAPSIATPELCVTGL